MNIYLKELIGGIDLSLMNRSGHLVLVGPGGTMASINANLKGPIPTNVPHLLEQINGKLEGVFSTEIEGETCLVAFEKLSNSDFYVLNLAYFDVLIASAKNIRNFTLLTMVGVIIVAIGIAYLVTLSITLPLNKLQRVLGKLPSKGFNLSFDDSYNDEIGILGHHFNTMVQEIQELINKVYVSEIHAKNLAFKKKTAELNALQMQINPHFLYNTLDIIRWETIALEEGNGKVSQMIESFSAFLRLSIPKHSELVPIAEEIRHVESYLEVINYRYQHKIKLTHTLDYDTLHICIPKLILQPIVENCILHAFKGNQPDKNIFIASSCSKDTLILTITDNGIGMSDEVSLTLNNNFTHQDATTQESIGLYNVCERIKLYYGLGYGLRIASSCPTGTTLEIKIPLVDHSAKKEDPYV
ncbi:MAG: sensor histidine kinase, partial [Cellulosilyticaceae bacterium]